MKRLKIFGRIEDFELFVNGPGIEIIQVDVRGCEQSIMFQESFIATVYYSEQGEVAELPKQEAKTAEDSIPMEELWKEFKCFYGIITPLSERDEKFLIQLEKRFIVRER